MGGGDEHPPPTQQIHMCFKDTLYRPMLKLNPKFFLFPMNRQLLLIIFFDLLFSHIFKPVSKLLFAVNSIPAEQISYVLKLKNIEVEDLGVGLPGNTVGSSICACLGVNIYFSSGRCSIW